MFTTKTIKRWKSWWSRKPQTIRRRPQLEALEDRLIPSATQVFAGLEFMTSGTFTTATNAVSATGPVQVGVNPAKGAAFTPLLQLDDGVQFNPNDATGTFTTTGTVSALAGKETLQLLDAHKHTFTAPGLLGSSFFTLPGSDTNQPDLPFNGGKVTVAGLRLSATVLDVQGSEVLPKLNGLTIPIQGNDFLAVNSSGVNLTGPDSLQTLPTAFSVGGLQLTTQSLHPVINAANNEFDLSGSASVSVADQTLTVSFGTGAAPGLVLVNGDVQSIDASIDSDLHFGNVTFKTEDLTIHYAATDPDVTITGKASLDFAGQTVEVALGANDNDSNPHPGIVIDKSSGTLVSLDAAVTTDVTIGSVEIKADGLGVHYAPADADFTITGTASFTLKDDGGQTPDQSVSLVLGDATHPGIEIDEASGNLVSFDAAISTDLTIGGLEIKVDSLGVQYQTASNSLVISGGASFTLDDHTVSLQLGGDASPGLVITNGQLTSLQASVTGDVDLLGIQIQAKDLGIAYVAATPGTPEEFELFGGVSVQTSFVNFDTTLGTEQAPGIVIVNGQLQSLNVTVDGGFSLFGLDMAANGLTIQYDGSAGQLELSGGLTLELTSEFQASATLSQGGLLINVNTGALSIDTSHGLDIMASAQLGPFSIQNLDIGFSNGPNGVNFHASGEVDLPGGIDIDLTKLDIQNGQLADVGLSVSAPIPIGDTGFFINTLSGELDNLNNPSQLEVDASATISFGKEISVPTIPGIFDGGNFSLVSATGSISVSASELKLSGNVSILGGLLGEGSANIDLNWTTGVYSITVPHVGIFDNIINFSGSFTVTSQGDITLEAMASVNIPPQIPFIGGDSLGSANFYLQYRPGQDWTQSYVAAWTSVNLFFTSFTVGFKVDFEGDFSLLNGDDVSNITSSITTTQQPTQYTYAQNVNVSAPHAAGAQVTVSSLDFFAASYADAFGNETVSSSLEGAAGNTTFTYYQLSKSDVILSTLKFEVYLNYPGTTIDVGQVSFDANGNFHFTPTGKSGWAPTGASLESDGMVILDWPGDPGQTSITATYYTSDAYLEVLQQTSNGPTPVGKYAIDPVSTDGQGMPSAALGGKIYTDQLSAPAPAASGGTWTTTYTLNHGDPNKQSLSFRLSSGTTLLGVVSFDKNGNFVFTPNGSPPFAPTAVLVNDDTISLTWTANPGATSITATYNSLNDRVIDINFNTNTAPGGEYGQYIVELVTSSPLSAAAQPTFAESIQYQAPAVAFVTGTPSVTSTGGLTGTLLASAFTPESQKPGDPSTTVSLYYTTTNTLTNGIPTNGSLIDTFQYSAFTSNGSNRPRSYNFSWDGFANLPAGQYYVYAVISDGQGPLQYSALSGPVTVASHTPALSGPSLLALSPNGSGGEQGAFSAAAGTALGVTTSLPIPVTVDLKVTGGNLLAPGGTPTTEFTQTYPTAAAATAALDGLQFVSDGTFTNYATLTYSASSVVNGTTYTAVQNILLLGPYTHLVVTQSVNAQSPADPGTAVLTVTVTNPGGIGARDGSNVQVQDYLSAGLTVLSFSASAGGYNPATGLWSIGNLPMTGANSATLTLTVQATANTLDTPLNSTAYASSDLFNFPVGDAHSEVPILPRSHDITISPGTLSPAINGLAYEAVFTADGGGGGPYTFAVTAGTLPAGLSLTPTGTLIGVPAAAMGGTYSFSVTASNAYGASTTKALTLQVANALEAVPGTYYSATLNNSLQTFYSVTAGSLPPGLKLTTVNSTAVLSGTPTTAGTYSFTIGLQQARTGKLYATQNNVIIVGHPITAGTANPPAAVAGDPFSFTFTATGGSGAYFIAPYSGQTPPGLVLSPAGVLSGTVPATAAPGTYTFTVYFSDSSGDSATRTYSLQVDPALGVLPMSLNPATVGRSYSATLTATGGSGAGYTFAVTKGTLPPGLSLSPAGVLSGTVAAGAAPGSTSFVITVTDSLHDTASQTFSLAVYQPVTVGPTALPLAEAGAAYSATLTATGGSGSGYTFAVTQGSLPAGLVLSPGGVLSGTVAPTVTAGKYSFTVTATDSAGDTGTVTESLLVDPALGLGPATLPSATVGTAYSQKLLATGGSGTGYTFAITKGSLPAGLTLTAGGLLSGTVLHTTPAGSYSFTVTVTDSAGFASQCTCSLVVVADTVTWTGAASTAWSNAANWSSHAVPGAGDNVTLPAKPTGGRSPVLDVAAVVDNLFIQAGDSLTLAGHALSVLGTLTNQGTVTLQGNEAISLAHGDDTTEGTWQLVGDGSGGTLPLPDFGAVDYFNLTIADTHSRRDTFQTATDLVVKGNLVLSGGTLTASGGKVTTGGLSLAGGVLNAPATLTDLGNWSVTGGTFNANNGTVVLAGTNQQISGNTTFYNLTKIVTAADTLTFQAGSTQTIGGTLTLQGASATSRLALRSSKTGSAWDLNPLGTTVASFVDVEDGTVLGKKPITATGSHNSGHDTGWTFS